MRNRWLNLIWAAFTIPAAAGAVLDNQKVAAVQRPTVGKAPDAQIASEAQPTRPIIPLTSAVVNGRVGKYVHSGMEMSAGLWLKADGTFEYGLTVGSLDETAKGHWTAQGDRIVLINDSVPVPPTITAGPATRDPTRGLQLSVTTPSGRGVQAVDLLVGFDAGSPVEDYTQSYGWTLAADEKRAPRWVVFSIASYGFKSPRFPIDTRTANVLNFVLTPNDIGVVNFATVKVTADDESVTIVRDGLPMRFEKQDER